MNLGHAVAGYSKGSNAWLALAVNGTRQHGGNDGYADILETSYSWDNTVPNHAALQAGDRIVLWDKFNLLGVSTIERIETGISRKSVHKCPLCRGSGIKQRKTMSPLYRCYECKGEFDVPTSEIREVSTYKSQHSTAWINLDGRLTGGELRALCASPASQLSLRPLRWKDFSEAVETPGSGLSLAVLDQAELEIRGGHTLSIVRVRIGQGQFRRALISAQGNVCAFTGPAPVESLEAAHLYTYAEKGRHHRGGGLLLRRDVHRLFDLGLLAIAPDTLQIDVSPRLAAYPDYWRLHDQALKVHVDPLQRAWMRMHWRQYRFAGRAD